jgi:hypothetical protein
LCKVVILLLPYSLFIKGVCTDRKEGSNYTIAIIYRIKEKVASVYRVDRIKALLE